MESSSSSSSNSRPRLNGVSYSGTPCLAFNISNSRAHVERGRPVKNRGKDSSRRLKLAVVLTLVSFILTIATLLVASVTINKPHSPQNNHENPPIACVECAHMNTGLLDGLTRDPLVWKMYRKTENGRDMCCAYNSEQMSAMFQAVMRRPERSDFPLPSYNVTDFRFSPASAHKRMSPEEISCQFGDIDIPAVPQTVHFRQRDEEGIEHHRGVDVEVDRLRVRHSGLYFVYSSVLFRPQSRRKCEEFDLSTFSNSVHRLRDSSSQQLLQTTYTCCDTCVNSQVSRFTGGLFLLNRSDAIQVRVSGHTLVKFEPMSSFAGIIMMGGVAEGDEEENM